MKSPLILLFLISLISCDPPPASLLNPEEEQMIGRWQEYAPKIPRYDSNGMLVDSTDVSALYEFKDDFTYTSYNEYYTHASSGSWAIDSTITLLYIYPFYGDSTITSRRDIWNVTHNPPMMRVGHTYEVIYPDKIVGVYRQRNFIKVE